MITQFTLIAVFTAAQLIFQTSAVSLAPHNAVSYLGDSYDFLPAEVILTSQSTYFNETMASNTRTSLEMWFKTARSDCLLILANGTKSSCALRLKGGRLEVEFRIDGSEKIQFLSPLSLGHFHDSSWHRAVVQRFGDEFSLSIDERNLTFRTHQVNPHSPFILDAGLHLGLRFLANGQSLSTRSSFRGCLGDIRYNGRDVMQMIKTSTHTRKISVNTQPTCLRQFAPESSDLPVQLLQSELPSTAGPYILFELNNSNEKSLNYLHFELKTASRNGPLFSTPIEMTATSKWSFCIELVEGSFYLTTIDSHGHKIHRSRVRINDGRWHSVDVKYGPNGGEITVDNITETIFTGSPFAPTLGPAIQFGSFGRYSDDRGKTKGHHFHGCLHNVIMNYRHFTSLNITSGHGMDVGCDDVCSNGVGSGGRSIDKAVCDQPAPWPSFPDPDPFPTYERGDEKKQALTDHAIHVSEGGSVRLEPRHFYFIRPSTHISIPNRNIIFHVNHKPEHGKLTLLEHAVSTFTYQDVVDGKVNYTHDGLEQREDRVELEVETRGIADGAFTAGFNAANPASGNWQPEQRYALPVTIAPLNDPPVIELPNGPVLRMAQNSRLRITNQEILVMDSDHDPADVTVKVIYATPNCGFFEHFKRPGLPATTFTQEDILNNYINYFHFGLMNGQTTLVASDPWEEGKSVTIEIRSFAVDFRQVANEGLNVFHSGNGVITSSNLEYSTNARNQSSDITYRIVRLPKYGRIEYEDEAGHWFPTRTFNQSQLDEGKIRYGSNIDEDSPQPTPQRDSFAFTLSTLNATSPSEHEFEIRFVRTVISVFNPTSFILNNTLKLHLSRSYLFATTAPRASFSDEIVYRLVRPPMYGLLYLVIDAATGRNRVLGLSSNFTQADIDHERVFYQLRYVHYAVVNDYFIFKLSALGATTGEKRYDITYLPGEDDFKLVNKTLVVQEGGLQRITNSTLYLETKDSTDFTFTISWPPKHGTFTLMAGSQMRQLGANDIFTSSDIKEGKLFYRHDDSETQSDSAYLIARPTAPSRGFAPQVPFWYSIKVVLVNDNPPKRFELESEQNRVFYVVRKGQRVLTNQDLWYIDADTDFDPLRLHYSFPNQPADGQFFYSKRPDLPLHDFTQEDINSGSVMFRHFGPNDVFTWPYSVSDGKHHTPGQFLVNASVPFIREKRNTGLKVQRGTVSILTRYNLTVETNLDVARNDIVYKIISPPRYGKLLFMGQKDEEGYQATTFSQADVDHSRILYAHNNATSAVSKKDWIAATVYAGTLEETVKIEISIFDADDSLLRIVNLRQLRVDRGGVVAIDSATLKAEHALVASNQITFIVKKPSSSGTLVLDQGSVWNATVWNTFSSAERFTQADVDEGKLHYVHRWTKVESASMNDEIIFDIYAPNVVLNGVVLGVVVVEREITLITKNLTVDKGGKRLIRTQHLTVKSSFDSATDDHAYAYVFTVVNQPNHGWLQLVVRKDEEDDEEEEKEDIRKRQRNPTNEPLINFRYKDVIDRKIRYIHDGSKTWKDELTLVAKLANDFQLQSKPRTIFIKVKHINEKSPEIIRNEPLKLHNQREGMITTEHLLVDDPDTPLDEIVYRVISPTGGHLALVNNLSQPAVEFTQKDIDEGRVAFVRSAGSGGGFYFSVSDGLHQLPAQQFVIQATELSVTLSKNERFTLSPSATVAITANYLKATVGNVDPGRIIFTVTKAPRLGILVRDGVAFHPSFTQKDINRNLIAYKQTKPMKKWEAKDAFSFIVSLNETDKSERLVPLEDDNKFKIVISYGAMDKDELSRYVLTGVLKLQENDQAFINTTHLNASVLAAAVPESAPLIFELHKPPNHGWLQLRSHNLSEGSQFAPQDLLNNWVVYRHAAGSSTTNSDSMKFYLFPLDESKFPLKVDLNVNVLPSPARRRTFQRKYLTPILKMVRGTRYQITSRDFLITTTSPSSIGSILYQITKTTANGFFAYASAPTIPIFEFTQEDINENRLDFIHNGSAGVANSSITFLITMRLPPEEATVINIDSNAVPMLNHTVQIRVDNLTLSCPSLPELAYRQGAQYVLITNEHLTAISNGPATGIIYNVTELPKNGVLYWLMDSKREPVSLFTQADVNARRILYAPLKMDASSDSFTVTIYNDYNRIPDKTMQIHVMPAVERNDIKVKANGTFLITEDVLKVGPEIVDRDPYFIVTRRPAFGLLVWDEQYRNASQQRNNRTAVLDQVNEFTAKDVKMKKIRYVGTMPVKHQVLDDRFFFEVRATGVQPARGSIRIFVVPGGGPVPTVEPHVTIHQPAPTAGVDAASGGVITGRPPTSTTSQLSPDIIRDHNIVIFVLVPVVFLALMFIIVRRVRVGKERERRRMKEKLLEQQRRQQLEQSIDRSRQDLLDATLYSLGTGPGTQSTDLSMSASGITRDTLYRSYGTGERTASIKSGTLHRNGNTLPTRNVSSEKANKGMLTTGAATTPTTPTSHSGYQTFFGRDSPPPPSSTRMVTFDPGRTEIISSVPMCKVTPLMPKQAASTCSSSSGDDFRYAYQYSSSASEPEFRGDRTGLDRSGGYRQQHQRKGPRSPIKQMKLKENQYWV